MTPGSMLIRATRWSLLGVFIGGMAVSRVFGASPGSAEFVLLTVAVYAAVGMVVTGRNPRVPIGWVFLGVGAITGFAALADAGTTRALADGNPTAWIGVFGAWVTAWFWFPMFALATLFTVLLYPSGLAGRRWRPVLWVSVLATGLLTTFVAVQPTLTVGDPTSPPCVAPYQYVPASRDCQVQVDNPLDPEFVHATDREGTVVAVVLVATLAACMVLAVISAVRRSRRAKGAEREQMRWFAFSAAVFVAWMLLDGFVVHTGPPLSDALFALALGLIPLSCGLAILRYHLYDIDRIISRTTSYAIVTGLLLGAYVAIVGTASGLLHTQSPLIVAAATLGAAALARPVLRRVQVAVDRRFNRSRYDAMRTVDTFGARLRDQVDPHRVSEDLESAVHAALQPKHVGLWTRPPGRSATRPLT